MVLILGVAATAGIAWYAILQRETASDRVDRWCVDDPDSQFMPCAGDQSMCELGSGKCSERTTVWCVDERDGLRICFGSLEGCGQATGIGRCIER